jgi:hypothetical protein
MSDGYRRQRLWYGDYGGGLLVTALTSNTTLIAGKTNYIVYVQRVHIHVNSPQPGVTWTVQDSNGNLVTGTVDATKQTIDPAGAEYDFGPAGIPLSAGAGLLFVPSASGAQGMVSWDAYQRQVPVMSYLATATPQ